MLASSNYAPERKIPAARLLEALEPTKVAQAALSDLAVRELSVRQDLANRLEELVRTEEREYPKRQAAVDSAVTALRKVEATLLQARMAVNEAQLVRSAASHTFSTQHSAIEHELLASASPEIAAFLDEMRDIITRPPQPSITGSGVSKHPVTGKRQEFRESNFAAINAFLVAVREVISEAEAMRLEPDQSTVAVRLAALRETLPKY